MKACCLNAILNLSSMFDVLGMKLTYKGLENFDCKKSLIRKPVLDAVSRSAEKLTGVITEINPSERIFLYDHMSVYKHSRVTNTNYSVRCEVWVFPIEYAYIFEYRKEPKEYTIAQQQDDDISKDLLSFAHWTVWEELFLQFAHIETILLKPNRGAYEGPVCVYNNKTKSDIEIIDSTWFTNLVKSDAFKVRGHFRIQPFGHGLKNRKLIWISDFTKHGYTREAKIMNEYPTTADTI